MDPTPRSAAEQHLDRARDDGDPVTETDVREQEAATEHALASLIADHPSISMSAGNVLAHCDSIEELRESAADLYPDRFGGAE
jgi:hypothetical protein